MNWPKIRLIIVSMMVLFISACSKSAPETLQKGRAFLAKGEANAAIIEFKNAILADPSSIDARIALGDALELTSDLTGAEQNYRKALQLGGNADELVPKIALILLDRGDIGVLIKDFADRELTGEAANSDLRGIVALAELAQKRKDKAEAQLLRARNETPAVRLARAQMSVLANQVQQATDEMVKVIEAGKAPWWVLRAASRLFQTSGDPDRALATIKGAYELASWHQGIMGEYAEQLFNAGKLDEARTLHAKLKKIAPRYYRTVFIEALFRMEDGHFDEAHNAAVKVLAALPEHVPALMIAAKVELERGELSSADARLRKVQFLAPYSIEIMRMQLMLELKRNNIKAASSILERALRMAPNDQGLLAASAELAWLKGERGNAVKQLALAVQTGRPPVGLLTRFAEMKFATGKRDEAVALIDKAMLLAGDKAAQREGVFRALLRMRFIDKAREMAKAELERRPSEPEPYLWMAAVVGSEGNEAAAIEQTKRALDMRADYYPALHALAKTATTEERARTYEERLSKAVDAGTKDARIYLDQGKRMRLAGADVDKIGALLERGIVADPESVGLREAAVRHWLAWGRKDKAVFLATGGEAENPGNQALKVLLASTHEAAGNMELAIAKYADLKARYPDRVDWGMKHAELLARAGKVPEAIQSLRKLISQRADEPAPYQMLAMLQVNQKQGEDALVTAAMLSDRPRMKAVGLLLRGDVLVQLEQDGKALKVYEEAGKAGAAEAALLRKLEVEARKYGGDYVLKELEEWLKKHPDSQSAMVVAVRFATAKGDYATVVKHLEAIDKLAPNNPVTLNDLAWAYTKLGKADAVTVARKANAIAPDNPQILDTLAEAQQLVGQRKEAMASLRAALSLAPQHPVFRVHLAELLIQEGSRKEAAGLLEGVDAQKLDKETAARLSRAKTML